MTYFITPDMVEMKDTTLKERIDKEIAKLRKYVTTVKYLASCEESWEFCETTFRDSTESEFTTTARRSKFATMSNKIL